jgi:hypothetical protein
MNNEQMQMAIKELQDAAIVMAHMAPLTKGPLV